MSTYRVDVDACDRSPGCPSRRACPQGAIVAIDGGAYPGALGYEVVEEKCTGCGACVRVCAGRAINAN